MFKKIPLILIFILFVPGFLYSKESSDSTKLRTKTSVGIRAGLYLSRLSSITAPNGPPMGFSFYVDGESNLGAGFSSGLFIDFKGEHSFSIQPEINFIWFSHDTQMGVVRRYQPGVTYDNSGFSTFITQLCLLPKISVGHTSNVKIMAGPFLKFPLITTGDAISNESSLQPCFGALACLRIDIPLKYDILGFEIRAGGDIVSAQDFKESSITLGLCYIFGLNR